MANKDIIVKEFDYDSLGEDAGKLRYYTKEVNRIIRVEAGFILERGQVLIEAREILTPQEFALWVDFEFPFSLTTANNAMRAARKFGTLDTAHLFDPSAMYLLADDDEARAKAVKLSSKGTRITSKLAKQLISAKSQDTPEPGPPEPDPPEDEDDEEDEKDTTAIVVEDMPCANCGGIVYVRSEDGGDNCKKCNHPYGEPVGDVDEDGEEGWKTQRSKATKTLAAAMRAVDDLHDLKHDVTRQRNAINRIKDAMSIVETW